jgi:predicted membrane GTPase involved in stress response
MTPYIGSLSITRIMVGLKKLIQKVQSYHADSIKSEPKIAEQKQHANLAVRTLNSAHLNIILDSAHFR